MLNLPYFMTGFFTSLTKTTSWILVRVFITIFATPYWHWLPLESYFLGTTESNLYYSIFLYVLCIFLVSFRASYLVDAPFNPESSHNHQYSVGLPLSSNNFFLWSIPPPPTHNCMTEVVTCFWHKTIFSRHMCDHGQSVVDWNPCTFCLWNIFPWVKQTNTIREISVYGKIPKWILLVIVCFLNIIFQNEIDVANLCRSRNLKRSCANVFQRCCYFYCFKIIPNYSTLPDVQARQGVIKAFRHILSKKVVM